MHRVEELHGALGQAPLRASTDESVVGDDIRQQILESDAGPTVICNWLKSLGYADATVNKVAALVRDRQANG